MASIEYSKDNLEALYRVVKPGDILEFPRGAYSHFGIYIGTYNGIKHCVIHFTVKNDGSLLYNYSPSLKACEKQCKQKLEQIAYIVDKAAGEIKTDLRADPLENVMDLGGTVIINNTKDKEWKPTTPEMIVQRAIDAYENQREYPEYHLTKNNCEHFVNEMRYKEHTSCQVDSAQTAGLAVGGGALLLGGLYALSKLTEKKEQKRWYMWN